MNKSVIEIICENCGARNKLGDKICQNCGESSGLEIIPYIDKSAKEEPIEKPIEKKPFDDIEDIDLLFGDGEEKEKDKEEVVQKPKPKKEGFFAKLLHKEQERKEKAKKERESELWALEELLENQNNGTNRIDVSETLEEKELESLEKKVVETKTVAVEEKPQPEERAKEHKPRYDFGDMGYARLGEELEAKPLSKRESSVALEVEEHKAERVSAQEIQEQIESKDLEKTIELKTIEPTEIPGEKIEKKTLRRFAQISSVEEPQSATNVRKEAIDIEPIPSYDAIRQQRLEKERLERERLEQERLEKERLERERLEQERLERERLERERLERERLERERLERERLEKERLEQERLEKERLEKERLERERLEKERLEKERLEQERLERERLEKERLEKERLEQERLEKERLEKERLEKERLERERLERERLERERLERERLERERLERERLERERLERECLEQERLEQERLEKERLEKERLERERLEQERLERERLEKERLERERLEKERLEKERLEKQATHYDFSDMGYTPLGESPKTQSSSQKDGSTKRRAFTVRESSFKLNKKSTEPVEESIQVLQEEAMNPSVAEMDIPETSEPLSQQAVQLESVKEEADNRLDHSTMQDEEAKEAEERPRSFLFQRALPEESIRRRSFIKKEKTIQPQEDFVMEKPQPLPRFAEKSVEEQKTVASASESVMSTEQNKTVVVDNIVDMHDFAERHAPRKEPKISTDYSETAEISNRYRSFSSDAMNETEANEQSSIDNPSKESPSQALFNEGSLESWTETKESSLLHDDEHSTWEQSMREEEVSDAMSEEGLSEITFDEDRISQREEFSARKVASFRKERVLGFNKEHLESFLDRNKESYIFKFSKLENGKAFVWSWAGFFFGDIWLLYRKQYLLAVLIYILTTISGILMKEASFAVLGFSRLLIGLFGNRLYYRYVKKELREVQEMNDPYLQEIHIQVKGRTNLKLTIVYILLWLIYLAVLLAIQFGWISLSWIGLA